MSTLTVSSITLYPIKALRGVSVQKAVVESRGLAGDRRLMVVDPDGRFVSQRECRGMALLSARWVDQHLVLHSDRIGTASVRLNATDAPALEVSVWDSQVIASAVSKAADAWLSEALERPLRLVEMRETTHRLVDPEYNRGSDIVSFADGYPYLILGDASLEDLNKRLEFPVEMRRFRPNITVSGGDPYDEDQWRAFQIGDVSFAGIKPCARCVVPTIDPDTGVSGKDPLKTLATYRAVAGKVLFGMNVVRGPANLHGDSHASGVRPKVIRVGDAVRVLERGSIVI